MNIVIERYVYLLREKEYRQLSKMEQKELRECRKFYDAYRWKKAQLENFSLLASMTGDTEWHHKICEEIEKID